MSHKSREVSELSGIDKGESMSNPMFGNTFSAKVDTEKQSTHIKSEHASEEAHHHSTRYQLCATLLILCAAAVGLGVGLALANGDDVDPDVISWIGLPGNLFIRSLKCVVLPLIFVNIILAVIQMIEAGKAGKVGKYTILMYLLTTLIASIEGLVVVVLFKDQFQAPEVEVSGDSFVKIKCENGGYLSESTASDGNVECVPLNNSLSSFNFEINDVNGVYQTTAGASGFAALSFSETLQNGIFKKTVPQNIVGEFANGNFVGVIAFAIVFGIAAETMKHKPVTLVRFLTEINDILVKLIQWIIILTPIAVFSLIAGAIGGQANIDVIFENIGVLVMATVVSMLVHVLAVYPMLFFIITKTNPYSYLRHIIPAQVFAFACASSAATLPVTMRCVKETGLVPDSIRNFVLPIGATINMDGGALYFPAALVFLAVTSGLGDQLDFAKYILIIIVSTIGSAGAAPVPNSGLVLIITSFNTVFGGEGEPANFFIIVAIDWLMDRLATSLNITGDTMVARIVTHLARADIIDGVPTSQLSIVGDDEDI